MSQEEVRPSNLFDLADELGPERIVHIHRAGIGLKAIVVVDNIARGPSVGGARMAPDVDLSECIRLARAMTLKNAAADLPHGGGKSVIVGDPNMDATQKQELIRAFAQSLKDLKDYIVGPDMGTNETCMAWIQDEIGRAVGLPREIGGIPLDEIGATGLGLAASAEVAMEFCNIQLRGARVAVQGFGAVGRHAAKFLTEKGCVLVAASDSRSMLENPDGLDVEKVVEHKRETGMLRGLPDATERSRDLIVGVDCDIWIPAARPDVLTEKNVGDLKARLVVQGANIPATSKAEMMLHERGVLSIPDFIANAGGVICAAVEYAGGSESAALEVIKEKIASNTKEVLATAKKANRPPRSAAEKIAQERVVSAMKFRRWN